MKRKQQQLAPFQHVPTVLRVYIGQFFLPTELYFLQSHPIAKGFCWTNIPLPLIGLKNFLLQSIKEDTVECFQWALAGRTLKANRSYYLTSGGVREHTRQAIVHGSLKVLQFLEKHWVCQSHKDPVLLGNHRYCSPKPGGENELSCTRICEFAAQNNQFLILRYLVSKNCPINHKACENAAAMGNLEMLQFLKQRGCPWDELTAMACIIRGDLKILQWVVEKRCPTSGIRCSGIHTYNLKLCWLTQTKMNKREKVSEDEEKKFKKRLEILKWFLKDKRLVWSLSDLNKIRGLNLK